MKTKGVALASDIGQIAKQLDRLASQTGPGAPKISLGASYSYGTDVVYKRKKHYLERDGYSMEPFIAALNTLLAKLGWRWTFVLIDGDRAISLEPLDRARAGKRKPVPTIRTIEDIVGAKHVLVDDAEGVDCAKAYVGVVQQLAQITGGALVPTKIVCREADGKRSVRVCMADRHAEATLRGDTDWIDVPPLLACLNELLPADRKLYEIRDAGWGQEYGVAYATADQVAELDASGYIPT